ncbi:hypothetical protein J1605_003840 [Eschrichtius robustus]|uniref:Uncharacterized protein n=1 Tax=Eschrichtius robustus TaxID=9764 RepID=A0AB34HLU1_ESCRO|nr:hypothetical protein J1605_003840 [Eschrichtius robustus]
MLLVPKAQGLVEMLQTIYETESCFSADGMPGREPSLEILPRTPLHGLPVAGVERAVPATSADFEWLVCLLIASSLVPKCFLEMAGLGEGLGHRDTGVGDFSKRRLGAGAWPVVCSEQEEGLTLVFILNPFPKGAAKNLLLVS